MRKIRVIIKQPGRKPYVTNISDRLGNLQEHVGGYIETVTLFKDLVIICNEEGRLRDLPYNCRILGIDFVGTIIFAGIKGEEFDDIPVDFKTFKKLFPDLWKED
ncbi:MAG: DUF3846 domain-containing protein [Firmicutes bacterium]|nr:DUF3846 domain-containing protein [Bacillota bacterium]